tara:strand:- start:1487 stop:1936 length:450 start_codon:yes stop_codon:yes gene_type:complete
MRGLYTVRAQRSDDLGNAKRPIIVAVKLIEDAVELTLTPARERDKLLEADVPGLVRIVLRDSEPKSLGCAARWSQPEAFQPFPQRGAIDRPRAIDVETLEDATNLSIAQPILLNGFLRSSKAHSPLTVAKASRATAIFISNLKNQKSYF